MASRLGPNFDLCAVSYPTFLTITFYNDNKNDGHHQNVSVSLLNS